MITNGIFKHGLVGITLLLLMGLTISASVVFSPQAVVLAQDEPPVEIQDTGILGWAWRATACTISDITIFPDRIHVRCTTDSPAGISFFAAATDAANALMTNRFLMILNTAYAMAKPVYILYDDQASANPPGCLDINCRKLIGIQIKP